jgi:hypothetical protein
VVVGVADGEQVWLWEKESHDGGLEETVPNQEVTIDRLHLASRSNSISFTKEVSVTSDHHINVVPQAVEQFSNLKF